jgi:hypothetical protein
MKTAIEKKKALLRQFHTICHVNGLTTGEKDAILNAHGVDSSTLLSEKQLQDIINCLSNDANMWRKRVFASIGAWLRKLNITESPQLIKSIACRASSHDDFNKIPVNQLRKVYYEFVRQAKISEAVNAIKMEFIQSLELQN